MFNTSFKSSTDNLPCLNIFGGLTKFKSHVINIIDSSAWKNAKRTLLNNQELQQNRKLYKLNYTMDNLSPDGKYPYTLNHLCIVNDDFIPMEDSEFLIYGLSFTGSKNAGYRTNLELCLPGTRNSYIAGVLWKFIAGKGMLAGSDLIQEQL